MAPLKSRTFIRNAPTNVGRWSAGAKNWFPDISYHWFRRGHATAQHHDEQVDKGIKPQLRHLELQTMLK